MLCIKTPFKDAEKIKKYLFKNNLFDKRYVLKKDNNYIYFPVLKRFKTKFEFVDAKLKKTEQKMNFKDEILKKLTSKEQEKLKTAFDIIGDIAVLEIDKELEKKEKFIAELLLKTHPNIKTVVKKSGIHEGVFRTQNIVFLAGINKKEAIHKENNTRIKLDIEKVYFSPRLSFERKRIFQLVKPNENILVMFSGCGVYPCVISKNTSARKIIGIEINPLGHKYALENLKLNKLSNIQCILGDVRQIVPKLKEKFDRIIMPLPRGAETFLDIAFLVSKKNTVIHLYDFVHENEIKNEGKKLLNICKELGKKCKILDIARCGQYAPREYRICVDFKIMG